MYCLIDVFLIHVTRYEIEAMKFIVNVGKVIHSLDQSLTVL